MKATRTARIEGGPPRGLLPHAAAAMLLALFVHGAASAQVSAVRARAVTLAEYRGRVGQAVTPLEELASGYDLVRKSEDYEVWSREGFSSDFIDELPKKRAKTFAMLRGLLPPNEKVEWGERFVEVDNSWVHEALGALDSEQDDEKTAAGLHALAGRLAALEARLRELDAFGQAALDRDAERGRLNSILRRPEFDRRAPRQESAVQRLAEEFFEWLASLFPRGKGVSPGGSPRVSKWVLVSVGGLCLLVLVYVARVFWRRRGVRRKSPRRRRGARVVLGERVEAEQTAADLLDEAERLARAGEMRGAIRKAYVALLCELGDRGLVRLAQHKTNRDYLDAVRRAADPRLYAEMLPLTNDFELHWYGLRAASDSDWQNFKKRCRTVLGSRQ